jgi:hypothetical protein
LIEEFDKVAIFCWKGIGDEQKNQRTMKAVSVYHVWREYSIWIMQNTDLNAPAGLQICREREPARICAFNANVGRQYDAKH